MGIHATLDFAAWAESLRPYAFLGEMLAVPASALLALLGIWASHAGSVRRQRLKAQFDFVSGQLERLYGPLYALVEANTAAYQVFRKTFGRKDGVRELDAEEWRVWRAWAQEVFVPSNLKIRDVIQQNAHLLVDGRMPDCFVRMLAHAESSRLALSAENHEDLALLEEFEPWPSDFAGFVKDSYFALSDHHAKLLGRLKRR